MRKVYGIVIVALVLVSAAAVSQGANPKIKDNQGHQWDPTAENLVIAFNSLGTNGQLWLPKTTFVVSQNLLLSKHGVKIHGGGATIQFTNGARLISSLYATATMDSVRYKAGPNNILIENLQITGNGCIECVLGNNTKLSGVRASNIVYLQGQTQRPAAVRFILPTLMYEVNGLVVYNCHTAKTFWHGFQVNAVQPQGSNRIRNVLFYQCSARYAGWQYEGRPSRDTQGGNWSAGFDFAENYNQNAMTVSNVVVRECIAEYNWECGFHTESAAVKNISYIKCRSDYNGQKLVYYPAATGVFCSGFIAEPNRDGSQGVKLYDCSASFNMRFGVRCRSLLGVFPVIVGLSGTGNREGLTSL